MNNEIEEIALFDKEIDCNQYRLRYLDKENIFNMQFGEFIKGENIRKIHYSFDFAAEDLKEILKNIIISSMLYDEKNGIDLIEETMKELDSIFNDETL